MLDRHGTEDCAKIKQCQLSVKSVIVSITQDFKQQPQPTV